ncbi:MAG: MotA/TolQ/ExbB proton channel family protein [Planctomycetota bacterium]|jgi:biopolymer transport protein ExbB
MIEEVAEKWASGGPLMGPIAVVSVSAWVLIVEKWLWLRGAGRPDSLLATLSGEVPGAAEESVERVCLSHRSVVGRAASGLLRVLRAGGPDAGPDLMREISLREFGPAKRRLPAIAVLASVAPLLGLLGTVTGMIETFDAITLFGTGNPRSLAEGISEALITTQAGLIVALPTLLAYNVLSRRTERFLRTSEDVLNRVRFLVERHD